MPSLLQSHIRQWKRINSPYVSSENTAGVYEELFPGLINWMEQPKIVLLIFVSAKIVLTGAKVSDETYTTFENIYPVLTEFRKNQQCFTRKLLVAVAEKWGSHVLVIDKVAPPN